VSLRQRFIDRESVKMLLDMATPTWRIIIALSRFGGLRCPSEVLSLEWRHIDWARNRITVPSPKTDRYEGKGSRTMPLFADLKPFLLDASELAESGQTHVVSGNHLAKAQGVNGWRSCNLRTTFEKLVKRAGLEPWPRLFHNLRSSRETELLEEFPVHVVAQWMGHDAKVSLKHYAQTTEDHFERASSGGAESGAKMAQNRAQQVPAENRLEPQEGTEPDEEEVVYASSRESMRIGASSQNGAGGIRTLGTVTRTQHFQCCTIDHSATAPVVGHARRPQGSS